MAHRLTVDQISNLRIELWASNSWRRFHFAHPPGGTFAEPYSQHPDNHPDILFAGGEKTGHRLAACWNACRGFSDPEAEVTRLRDLKVVAERVLSEVDAAQIPPSLLELLRSAVCSQDATAEKMPDLTQEHIGFLQRLRDGLPLAHADSKEDRLRQSVRRLGLAAVAKNPRRWVLTDKGQAALNALVT